MGELCRYRFGLFEFDSSSGELHFEGAPAGLEPQPARLLGVLLGRAGEVVTREELVAELWGERAVEEDQGLAYCVRQVRLALRDDARNPRFLQTLPRKGYRFIAPVAPVRDDAPPEPAPVVPAYGPRPWWLGPLWFALILAAVALAYLIYEDWEPKAPRRPAQPPVAMLR